MTTIAHIAEETGLAKETVAQVLNDRPGYSQRTRQRIMEAARRLNYRPDYLSKALAGGRSMSIGLVPGAITARVEVEKLRAIEAAAREQGLVVYMTGWDENTDEKLSRSIQDLLDRRVDGLVLYRPAPLSEKPQQLLDNAKVPVVYVDWASPNATTAVRIDKQRAVRTLADHLAGLGHRCAAYIQTPFDRLHPQRKSMVYQELFGQAGIEVDLSDRWLTTTVAPQAPIEIASYLMICEQIKNGDLPSVVLAHNDHSALGVLRALQEHGVRVPEDISVVGFDDVPFAQLLTPALTTIRQPGSEVGRKAFALLASAMEGESPAREQAVYECELVVRDSTGPATDT